MERSIDDILNNTPVDEAPVAEAPVSEATTDVAGIPRDEHGRFAKKEETGVAEPAPAEEAQAEPAPPAEPVNQLPKDVYEPLKAVRDENKELKQRLQALERSVTQPAPQPQQPPADFWDDPQGFMAGFGSQLLQQFEQRQQAQRLDASEKAAKAKYDDYDDAFSAFSQAVQANPSLALELAQSDNPGEFAYAKGKAALEIQRVGSLDDLRAQIRAELEAEARAAMPKPSLPSTTAADGSVGARTGPAWAGPTPLTQILG